MGTKVPHAIVNAIGVRREQHQRATGREISNLGVLVAVVRLRPAGAGEIVGIGRKGVFRIVGDGETDDSPGRAIAIVEAEFEAAVVGNEHRPGGVHTVLARTPDYHLHGRGNRRELDHRLDLVPIRLRVIVGLDARINAVALNIRDRSVAGRQGRRRRQDWRGGERCGKRCRGEDCLACVGVHWLLLLFDCSREFGI